MTIEEEIALVLHRADCACDDFSTGLHDQPYWSQARALSPLLNRVRAEALREAIDGTILSWHSLSGVVVWDSQDHYNEGAPRPLAIEDWFNRRADRIEQNSEGNET